MNWTQEQINCINSAVEKNTFIVAAPGSGKSTLLAEITKRLLKKDPKNKVLLVTFTNKSAKDIIHKAGGMNDRVYGGTFHSIAYRTMLKNNVSFNICDTNKQNMIIKKIFDVKDDKKEFENIKNEISITKSDYPQRICEYTEQYNNELKKYNMYDFDDIINNFIDFIDKREFYFDYTHILVDEMQDTSSSQMEFLRRLHKKFKTNMIGVADISQSIYSFRGAIPENVHKFIKDFKCKQLPLAINFRSKNNIIIAARNLIENNKTHIKVDFRSHDKEDGIIRVKPQTHPLNEISEVISICRLNRKKEIAILYRNRTNKMQLEFELRKSNLNYTVLGGTDLVDRSAFRVYISLLKIASKEFDIYDIEIASKGLKGLGSTVASKIKTLLENPTKVKESKTGQMCLIAEINSKTEKSLNDKIKDICLNDKRVNKSLNNIFNLQEEFEVLRLQNKKLSSICAKFKDYITPSFSIPKDILDFIEDITKDYHMSPESIRELCNNLGLDDNSETYNEDALIQLSTIHNYKGGERDVIILPFCDWKMKENIRIKDPIEDERRLFYVAVTRAKKELYITYTGEEPQFVKELLVTSKSKKFKY